MEIKKTEYVSKEFLLKNVREIGAYKAVLLVDIMAAPVEVFPKDEEEAKAEKVETAVKRKKK